MSATQSMSWMGILKQVRARSDLLVSLLIVPIVALMILPVPVIVLDSLLAVNLTLAVMLLMATLFAKGSLSLSTFPSLLLFTTLFRLGLNIASTKSILLHADAGHLIETFGELVVGGNLVVGVVVFTIITVVQFVVITKGSERVAEVGARFTLDAMPGKQMAIDADMRAGHLSAQDAQRRRDELASESKLHGGMDGAMKFVKGDAIAGLVITLINLCGGIVVGVIYHNMSAGEAANHFAILSIGDAMVSSIPSLFISLAAGVLITRVDTGGGRAESGTLGKEIVGQLTSNATALWIACVMVCALAAIPGFPHIQFLLLAGCLAWLARNAPSPVDTASKGTSFLNGGGSPDQLGRAPFAESPPPIATGLTLRLSTRLAAALDARVLDDGLKGLAGRLQLEMGMPFPSLSVWQDLTWADPAFEIQILDVPFCTVEVPEGCGWLMNDQSELVRHASRVDLTMLRRSVWWCPKDKGGPDAGVAGVESLIGSLCHDIVVQQAPKFLGVQEVIRLIETVGKEFSGLVAEVQKVVPMQRLAEVLKRLLEEGVPIRNARSILEALVTWGPREKDVVLLTEHVRQELGGWLSHRARGRHQQVPALLLDVEVEQMLRQNLKPTPAGSYIAISPEQKQWFESRIEAALASADQEDAVLIVSMDIRRSVRRLVCARWPMLHVYSYQELEGHGSFNTLALIGLEA